MQSQLKTIDVARFFVYRANMEDEGTITHLKLQKLLYYAQGFHLALYDTPLFTGTIYSWQHGPVCEDVWHQYKQYGSERLPYDKYFPESESFQKLSEDQREFLGEVHEAFSQFTAWKLRELTHTEPPWLEGAGDNSVISHESMKRYFKTQLVEDGK